MIMYRPALFFISDIPRAEWLSINHARLTWAVVIRPKSLSCWIYNFASLTTVESAKLRYLGLCFKSRHPQQLKCHDTFCPWSVSSVLDLELISTCHKREIRQIENHALLHGIYLIARLYVFVTKRLLLDELYNTNYQTKRTHVRHLLLQVFTIRPIIFYFIRWVVDGKSKKVTMILQSSKLR